MKKYNVGVVGVGAVGAEMVRLLEQRNFPIDSLRVFGRTEREEHIADKARIVEMTTAEVFHGLDFAFFAGTEGEKGASKQFGWEAAKYDCIVIDNGDDFRMDSRVPLVIPEINPEALKGHRRFIANPNCSTIIMLMALAPLHRFNKIRRITASTYQAVSGSGSAGVKELDRQATAWAHGHELFHEVYPHPILHNVIPAVGSFKSDDGESTEEIKMRKETHKILVDDSILISTTCVRVPVVNGHSMSLNVEFEEPMPPEQAREILGVAPGIVLMDNPKVHFYPTPLRASGISEVLVGRIRRDQSVAGGKGLTLFCSGDNIWKGAALNAIQIAEALIRGK